MLQCSVTDFVSIDTQYDPHPLHKQPAVSCAIFHWLSCIHKQIFSSFAPFSVIFSSSLSRNFPTWPLYILSNKLGRGEGGYRKKLKQKFREECDKISLVPMCSTLYYLHESNRPAQRMCTCVKTYVHIYIRTYVHTHTLIYSSISYEQNLSKAI